jgi:hypothetical protein
MSSVVGIVPLYNHALTVPEVLAGLHAHGLYAVIVDDGSTDGGADIAEQWLIANGASGQVIRLPHNQGKAAALLAGFAAAADRGATHALTIDADGQHDSARIAAFLKALPTECPEQALVLGDRRALPRTYPTVRLLGRFLSGLAVRTACGAIIGDAACGMRLYPLAMTRTLRCISGRYAWEEEAIIRLVWAGASVQQVEIPVIYRDAAVAPSHYQFGRDWTEGTLVLVFSIILRAFTTGRRWARNGSTRIDLLWPLGHRTSMARCMMNMLAAFTVAITGFAVAALTACGAPIPVTASMAAIIMWVVWRTNAPILLFAVGLTAGIMAPIATLFAAPVIGATWSFIAVHRRRSAGN